MMVKDRLYSPSGQEIRDRIGRLFAALNAQDREWDAAFLVE